MRLPICPAITTEHKGNLDALFRTYEDLFIERFDEWPFVSRNIAQYKFYITPLRQLIKDNPELLAKMVKAMTAMDIGIGTKWAFGMVMNI